MHRAITLEKNLAVKNPVMTYIARFKQARKKGAVCGRGAPPPLLLCRSRSHLAPFRPNAVDLSISNNAMTPFFP